MRVSYQRETLGTALPDMEPLFPAHWEELALNRDRIKLAPDVDRYRTMEKFGTLHLFTARVDDKLVGYYVSAVGPHPHYRDDVVAVSDMFYICSEYRKGYVGIGLFRAMEADVRRLGASLVLGIIKPSHDIGPMLKYLGWELAGYVYSKCLKSESEG